MGFSLLSRIYESTRAGLWPQLLIFIVFLHLCKTGGSEQILFDTRCYISVRQLTAPEQPWQTSGKCVHVDLANCASNVHLQKNILRPISLCTVNRNLQIQRLHFDRATLFRGQYCVYRFRYWKERVVRQDLLWVRPAVEISGPILSLCQSGRNIQGIGTGLKFRDAPSWSCGMWRHKESGRLTSYFDFGRE